MCGACPARPGVLGRRPRCQFGPVSWLLLSIGCLASWQDSRVGRERRRSRGRGRARATLAAQGDLSARPTSVRMPPDTLARSMWRRGGGGSADRRAPPPEIRGQAHRRSAHCLCVYLRLKAKELTAVGFEPTPFRSGALSHRLRPLGQTVTTAGPITAQAQCCARESRAFAARLGGAKSDRGPRPARQAPARAPHPIPIERGRGGGLPWIVAKVGRKPSSLFAPGYPEKLQQLPFWGALAGPLFRGLAPGV